MAASLSGWFWPVRVLFFHFLLSLAAAEQETGAVPNDPGLHTFISRPDIRAPKWTVTVSDERRLAPGLWFIGPYRTLDDDMDDTGWVGPHIYDGRGELVWSGARMFSKGDIEDFRISNVRGQQMMTFNDPALGAIVVMNNCYEIIETKKLDVLNPNELNFVHDGTRALVLRGRSGRASEKDSKMIGLQDERCLVQFDLVEELDVMNEWKPVFSWSTLDHLSLVESTFANAVPETRCNEGEGWDFIHINSVDKTEDGHYLLSGSHTDTIYKISKFGDITWRLGGVKSDFALDDETARFSRQNHVRFRGQNETHTLISIMDNAKGEDNAPSTHKLSRGLVLALNERDKTVSVELEIDHPNTLDRYTHRGSFQILPNGNVFMGWSEEGLQTEHSADGTLLMQAKFQVNWLGSYRQYKFPFIGEPKTLPDVFANATGTGDRSAKMDVHVSWNGATEVRKWQLYKTTHSGDRTILLSTAERTGFETAMSVDRFAAFVMVAALDKSNNVLSRSTPFETELNNIADPIFEEEMKWLQSSGDDAGVVGKIKSGSNSLVALLVLGVCLSAAIVFGRRCLRRRGTLQKLRHTLYHQRLDENESEVFFDNENSIPLQGPSKKQKSFIEREVFTIEDDEEEEEEEENEIPSREAVREQGPSENGLDDR